MTVQEKIAIIQAGLTQSKGDVTYARGFDILRWFLKGWVAHADAGQQKALERFHFNKTFDGEIIFQNDVAGFEILRAAFAGKMICALEHNDPTA